MNIQTNIHILVKLIIILVAISCNKNNGKDIIIVSLENATPVLTDSITENLEIIPLEIKNGHFPYGVNNIFIPKDNIIVSDNKNIIFVYNSDGKYISDSANKIGKGEGEYSIVTAISYNRHSGYIEVATPINLLFYDLHFNLVKKTKLPTKFPKSGTDGLFFGFLFDISDHEHILIPESVVDNNRKAVLFDSDTEKIIDDFAYGDDIFADMTMQNHCFYDGNDGNILFFPPGITNYVYNFDSQQKKFTEKYFIDFGKNGVSKSDLDFGSDKEKQKSFVMSTNKAVPLRTMKCKDYILVVTKDGNSLKNFHTFVWNLESESIFRIDSYENETPAFPLIDYADNSGLYCIMDSESLSKIESAVNQTKIKRFKQEIPEGSLILLKYQLKDSI